MSAGALRPGGSLALPIGMLLGAIGCFQFGGVLAKGIFPTVGPMGASALRMGLAAILLWIVARPWRARIPAEAVAPLLLYGAGLAGLNLFYYLALQRIPIGIAVAIDFTGPLAVAVLHSRRPADLACVGLAGFGILLLLPIGPLAAPLDPRGVALSFASAICWGTYIMVGKRVARLVPPAQATALGTAAAAAVTSPFGLAQAGSALLAPAVLPVAIVLASVSSALPFTLELFAMKRLPLAVFGVLMSLEPAFGALYGRLFLGEVLSARQVAAIGAVMLASAATAWGRSSG